MQKKYQVFVSSTFRDLVEERQDAIRNILDLKMVPAGMELFPASDTEQLVYIKKVIDECDYYVLIMGGRYGSLDSEGISFTEREYDYAMETGKTVLAFPHGDLASIPVAKSEMAERMRSNLAEFRAKVMSGRLVREWTTREQLESLVIKALVLATSEYPAVGWIRGDAAASEDLLGQVNALRIEVQDLRKKNAKLLDTQQPKLTDLASGSELISLRFTYTYQMQRGSRKGEQRFELSWDEIFLAIAKHLAVSRSTGAISSYIAEHLRENRGEGTYYSLFETDEAVVKNQLVALGLIEAYVSKTMKDGSPHEFMRLTLPGRSKLTQALAVKTGTSPPALSCPPSAAKQL